MIRKLTGINSNQFIRVQFCYLLIRRTYISHIPVIEWIVILIFLQLRDHKKIPCETDGLLILL